MSSIRVWMLFSLLWFLPFASVSAQDVQVPFDRDSTLYTIDAELREELGLFPEIDGFQSAEMYRVAEDTYELVFRYQRDGKTLRGRRSFSSKEVEALRQRISQDVQTGDAGEFNQEGRYGLLAATTSLGVAQGGLIAGALDTGSRGASSLLLLSGASGFFGPLFATQSQSVTTAEADMVLYGGVQGYVHAVQLSLLVDEEVSGRAMAGTAALFGAAEATGGYLLARKNNWSGGHSEMLSYSGVSGTLIGFGVGASLIANAGSDVDDTEPGETRVVAGTSLLGSIAGGYLGHRMGRTGRYTQGDARIYLLSGLMAANLTSAILASADTWEDQTLAILLSGSGTGGLALGRVLVRDHTFTRQEGNLVFLGTSAGSLLGLGIAAALGMGEDGANVSQAVGSLAGFGITYSVFSQEAGQRGTVGTSSTTFDLRVTPTMTVHPTSPAQRSLSERIVPRVTLSTTF